MKSARAWETDAMQSSGVATLSGLGCVLLALTSCGNYCRSRCSDFTDILYLEHTPASYGAILNAGPIVLGYHQSGFLKHGKLTKVGLGGAYSYAIEGEAYGFVIPFALEDYWSTSRTSYNTVYPNLGSIGFNFSYMWFFSMGIKVDVIEAVDFASGLIGIDIMGDDFSDDKSLSQETVGLGNAHQQGGQAERRKGDQEPEVRQAKAKDP